IFRFCTKYARRTLAIVSTVTIPLLTPGANHALGAGLPPGGWGQICTPITPKRGSKLHAALHNWSRSGCQQSCRSTYPACRHPLGSCTALECGEATGPKPCCCGRAPQECRSEEASHCRLLALGSGLSLGC